MTVYSMRTDAAEGEKQKNIKKFASKYIFWESGLIHRNHDAHSQFRKPHRHRESISSSLALSILVPLVV